MHFNAKDESNSELVRRYLQVWTPTVHLLLPDGRSAYEHVGYLPPEAFLAALPRALLTHPNGGALACIGHIDRGWGYSITPPRAGPRGSIESSRESLAAGPASNVAQDRCVARRNRLCV